ncbi:hypothetical protein G6F64_014464 [Rhizopus arrhizus]|uniref:Nucleotidyl transferase domain-containing protein n=1 Tax=Rhizopus oryzae TaxID=64495 RepID=A0A9P7BIY5_RHIOR|nr:hypothetical protein G6F64_014464 [Rhizopus arrhizus]
MPSPVVALNRVVAVSRSDGAFAAWALLQPLLADARLQGYAPLQVVRGDLLQQLGRAAAARAAFAAAYEAARQGALVTFGITPTAPLSGYGYIQAEEPGVMAPARRVRRFVEKPSPERHVRLPGLRLPV